MPAKMLQCYVCCVRTEQGRGVCLKHTCHQNSRVLRARAAVNTAVLSPPTQPGRCRHTDYNVQLLESLKKQVWTAQRYADQARLKCKG